MTNAEPKRFYKQAAAEPASDGWTVTLDGRPVKTPARSGLILPTETLAQIVAEEWDQQTDALDLSSMTLTRLANVAIDRTPSARPDMIEELTRYAETDLICHLEDREAALRARQDELWSPWRRWAGHTLNIVLVPIEGVIASPQPEASLQALKDHASVLDDFHLTALSWASALYGSIVLGVAVQSHALSALDAFDLSCLDSDFQAEKWGQDEEAKAARDAREKDANAIGRWFEALSN